MIKMIPVGHVDNEFLEPFQDEEKMYESVSRIIINEEFSDGLYRIEDFEKLQILFCFSRFKKYKLIQKRWYDGQMAGVFASRTPRRPNGIGLTTVQLLKVENNVLVVKGLDAINGTPVLDIKPYVETFEQGPDQVDKVKDIRD